MVVKLLMKMEESVCSSKQLSVKDGEVIYSPYEEHYFFSPSDCHSFNEELTYLGGDSGAKLLETYWMWL